MYGYPSPMKISPGKTRHSESAARHTCSGCNPLLASLLWLAIQHHIIKLSLKSNTGSERLEKRSSVSLIAFNLLCVGHLMRGRLQMDDLCKTYLSNEKNGLQRHQNQSNLKDICQNTFGYYKCFNQNFNFVKRFQVPSVWLFFCSKVAGNWNTNFERKPSFWLLQQPYEVKIFVVAFNII